MRVAFTLRSAYALPGVLLCSLFGLKGAKSRLRGADLRDARLVGIGVRYTVEWTARFHRGMILPDGTKWTPETDMTRFTNSAHPEYKDYIYSGLT